MFFYLLVPGLWEEATTEVGIEPNFGIGILLSGFFGAFTLAIVWAWVSIRIVRFLSKQQSKTGQISLEKS